MRLFRKLPSTDSIIEYDFTNDTEWTAGKVNAIRTRILYNYCITLSPTVYVDWIGVQVDYTTTEEVTKQTQEQITEFLKTNWVPLSVLAVLLAIVISLVLGLW